MNRNHIIIQSVGVCVYTLIYLIFNIKQNYREEAYLFNSYYPLGIVIGVLMLLIVYRLLHWTSRKEQLIGITTLVVMLIMITSLVQNTYGPILSHYYRNQTSSLLGLYNYSQDDGNLLTVRRMLRSEGIGTNDLASGYTLYNDGSNEGTLTSYWSGGYFIVYDWQNKEVIVATEEALIMEEAYDSLVTKNIPDDISKIEGFRRSGCTFTFLINETTYCKVNVYPERGYFTYISE